MAIIFVLMSIGSMSHVDFKKWPCYPVEFKGQGPYLSKMFFRASIMTLGCIVVPILPPLCFSL